MPQHPRTERWRSVVLRNLLRLGACLKAFAATTCLLAVSVLVGPRFLLGKSAAPAKADRLPILTTIRAVHSLSYDEAVRRYPVHIKAIVTYYDIYIDRPLRPMLMVTDGTASSYVAQPGLAPLPLKPGSLVDIVGVSGPGLFAPEIDDTQIRVLVPSVPLPPAPRVSLAYLISGVEDAQWSEIEGVVESVQHSGNNTTLKLGLADGTIAATTVQEPGVDYDGMVDAKVTIRGIAASLFNRKRQIFGARLLFPNVSAVHVEKPAPARPFEMRTSSIGDLMRFQPEAVFTHRVHLRGVLTLLWPGRLLCIQNNLEALCAGTAQSTPLKLGERADVIGFPEIGDITPTLIDAEYQAAPGVSSASVAAVPIQGEEALNGERDAQLVQIDATVAAHDRASKDPIIVVTSGRFTFPAILPSTADAGPLLALEEGTKIRITGICSVEADSKVFTRHDGYPVTRFFRIMLRDASDVVILERPSWWSARHALRVMACALVVTLAVLGWVVILRQRVRQQTDLLRHQATHDVLTGLWNRRAICDQLQRESEIAARAGTSIGVVMLDADRFKQVNDTHGHLAGDAVLKELARRIPQTLRSFDLTGRYGGEEFLVVLPGCTSEHAFACAERIRNCVADSMVDADGVPLSVTVSIGTAVLDPRRNTQTEALAAADAALYEAKRSGRNRVVSSARIPPREPVGHESSHSCGPAT